MCSSDLISGKSFIDAKLITNLILQLKEVNEMSKCCSKSDPSCKDYAEKVKNKANEKTPYEIDKPTKHF